MATARASRPCDVAAKIPENVPCQQPTQLLVQTATYARVRRWGQQLIHNTGWQQPTYRYKRQVGPGTVGVET